MSPQHLSDDALFTAIDRARQDLSRQQRQATLTHVSELMRARGASEHAIQSALHGFHAFLHATSHHPHQPATSESDTVPAPVPNTPGCLFSDIETRPIQWLWPQRLPLGKLTLLEGEAGIGTTLLALTLAAAVSSGQPLPGAPSCQPQPGAPVNQPGHVIIISPQESACDILKPRLESAGADSGEIARPARGLYIAHQHRLASNTPPDTDTPTTPATSETFDTPATTTTSDTPATTPCPSS